jgi:hypothetical protein
MKDYPPFALRVKYRATHSVLWELAEKSGILGQMNLSLASLDYADDSREAEAALFRGDIDFVSGKHVSPYLWVARGEPIVCLASPGNTVQDQVVTREPVTSLADFRDKGFRIADTNLIRYHGHTAHTRANHILEVIRAGYEPGEAEWVEVGQPEDPEFQERLFDSVRSGKADAAFVTRRRGAEEPKGVQFLELPVLPMINGTTITTSYEVINKKEGLPERLVRAMVETIHYARMRPEEAQRLLDTKMDRPYAQHGGRAASVARFPMKPYPTQEGIANAYELCTMQYEEAKAISPIALWDMHYLRNLDLSGFIDELIQEQPANARYEDA